MSWIAIVAIALTVLGGGSVGVAYAADGSSPGDALYGLDRGIESFRYALTASPEARAQLAMAFADERLAEAGGLLSEGASDELVQEALGGYGVNISQAAGELAAVAASGDEARTAALAALLEASLSVHTQVLTEVMAAAPSQAQGFVGGALDASNAGMLAIGAARGQGAPDGIPAGPPASMPGGPPEVIPAGPPDNAAGGMPEGVIPGAGEASFEERVAGLNARIDQAQDDLEEGDVEGAEQVLVEYQNEVDALAQELAAVAQEDETRAQALASLLNEALTIHNEILTQLLTQVPEHGRAAIEGALTSSEAGLLAVQWLFPGGLPGAPAGVPAGPPG